MAEILQADLFEIVPAEPYTTEDLNYNDDDSRSSQEMNDETSRPALAETVKTLRIIQSSCLPIQSGGVSAANCSTFVESVVSPERSSFRSAPPAAVPSEAAPLICRLRRETKEPGWKGRRFAAGTSREELGRLD